MEFNEEAFFRSDEFVPYFEDPDGEKADAKRESVVSKVLVVDDEKLLADTTAVILRSAHFDVKVAYNGWQALEIAQSFRPDFMITDIMMPMMSGVDLAIAIRNMLPSTRIILFSGQAGVTDILKDCEARGYSFPLLAKPVRPAELIRTLKESEK